MVMKELLAYGSELFHLFLELCGLLETSRVYIHHHTSNAIQNYGQSNTTISIASSIFGTHPKLKKLLVLDLDETLIHSSTNVNAVSRFTRPNRMKYDYTISATISHETLKFYISKRPNVDFFLEKVLQWYEVAIFTASLRQYADPIINFLDPHHKINKRLFREVGYFHTCKQDGVNYIKDLNKLCDTRDLSQIIIIDNSPAAYSMNRDNAIPIEDWEGSNLKDTALLELLPLLYALSYVKDVRSILSLKDIS